MSEMIERVARRLAQLITEPGAHPDSRMAHCMVLAKEAIEEMREPTDAMCEAADWHQQSDVNAYQRAIDTALTAPSSTPTIPE